MSEIDEAWVRDQVARQRAEQDARLAEVREAAGQRGKEPFDLDAFERLYDTETSLGHLPPRQARERRWAIKYYLDRPEVMTMAELAAYLETVDPWR